MTDMKKYVYMVMAIVGLSALAGCKEDAYIEPLITETCGTYYYDRLDRPERIIHAGSVFSQYDYIGSEECRFSLSDKKFRGRTYLQINIGNMPTDMLVRVDGDVFWGYDPQTESEFKMYDFSKWPLEEGDSVIYRIYEVKNRKIAGIADYSDVLKKPESERMLGEGVQSRCTIYYNDDIYDGAYPKTSYPIILFDMPMVQRMYSYSLLCKYYEDPASGGYYIERETGPLRLKYALNFGAIYGNGLFFKEKDRKRDNTCSVKIRAF